MYTKYAELRDALNLTDYRVCKDLGIPKSTMSEWKRKQNIPKTETIIKISNYFHKPVDYFVKE